MDEVENPEISPAGQEIAAALETAPPLDHGIAAPEQIDGPVADTTNLGLVADTTDAGLVADENGASVAGADTVDSLGLEDAPVVKPKGQGVGKIDVLGNERVEQVDALTLEQESRLDALMSALESQSDALISERDSVSDALTSERDSQSRHRSMTSEQHAQPDAPNPEPFPQPDTLPSLPQDEPAPTPDAAPQSVVSMLKPRDDHVDEPDGAIPKPKVTKRPILRRDHSSTKPPAKAPPAVPEPQSDFDYSQENPGSLSIAQLRELRKGFPDATPNHDRQHLPKLDRIYDFDYTDSQSFPLELDEWFTYSEPERGRLHQIHATFKSAWAKQATPPGRDSAFDFTESPDLGMDFVNRYIERLRTGGHDQRNEALQVLCYIALGNWEETAGRASVVNPFASLLANTHNPATYCGEEYLGATFQIQWIINTLCLLARQGAIKAVFDSLKSTCDHDFTSSAEKLDTDPDVEVASSEDNVSVALWCSLTLMYLFVEVGRLAGDTLDGRLMLHELSLVQSELLLTCVNIITKMRWDDHAPIPPTKVFLLTWKSILLCFGGMEEVGKAKASFGAKPVEKDNRGEPIITASPLDYHLFRQEICSKYPACRPPPPLFPFEPENNTILPPLRHRQSKLDSIDSTASEGRGIHGASLMHQPVHIATPAPSPPPSPAMGGKPSKKQNYQTNQMFPFLYPPLDSSSNDFGGKGSTELQDALAGRQWQGSDIPTSILEAADLFSTRMRATRAMKQLWETRVDFIKFERGWKEAQNDVDVDDFVLLDGPPPTQKFSPPSKPQTDIERRLAAVEDFYRDALPNLQSFVGVLLGKIQDHLGDLNLFPQDPRFENGNGVPETSLDTADQINNTRNQEIMNKAVSGTFLVLLKWFRVSHVLRYEYLTQLLLDQNFVPTFIKLWSVTDIGRACHFRLDKEDLDFFYFCRINSRNPPVPQPPQAPLSEQPEADESEDDAMPPPIKLQRADTIPDVIPLQETAYDPLHPPEVDELGFPVTPLPAAPLRNFSTRNTLIFINYLRILQKITRRKAHRSLLLVSYKSSTLLRKSLRVPVDMMRYYTLKLFKSQVPYCGRKWRASNMKIITAVWLSVPADLRDDWLSGGGGGMGGAGPGDVDGTVEEALPLEQSLRALTHWWNVRTYPDIMGVDREMVAEEQDFFAKELEKIEVHRVEEEMLEDGLLDEPWAPLEAY